VVNLREVKRACANLTVAKIKTLVEQVAGKI